MKSRLFLLLIILLSSVKIAQGERIKDIVDIQGIRSNPLTGTGLVIGLAGTGDSTLLSQRMLTNILRDSGLVLSPSDLTGGNIAAITVTAQLGPFAREGSSIDVAVSSIGDAKSLQGGMLLPTPLRGLDGQVYAVAYGTVFIGGWSASGNRLPLQRTIRRLAEYRVAQLLKRLKLPRSLSTLVVRGLSHLILETTISQLQSVSAKPLTRLIQAVR